MNDKQKKWVDARFNKAAVSQMTKSEFVKIYTGKLSLHIDINDLAKYLDVKPDKAVSYTSKTTLNKSVDKEKESK